MGVKYSSRHVWIVGLAAVEAAGQYADQPYEGWIAADPFGDGEAEQHVGNVSFE